MLIIFLTFYLTLNLQNGLHVIYKKKEKTDIFTFLLIVNSGSFNEEQGFEGMTHFLEHMLFDGNEKFSREELNKNFDKLGLYVNAFTREDYTAYFFSGPDENYKEGIYLLYLMIFKSTFPDKEFEKEKKVVLQEIYQDRSREFNITKEKVDSIIYLGTNYSHPIIGYERTIKNLKKEKVIEFYKRFYVPNNMVIFLNGDIDEKELFDFIEKTFGRELKGGKLLDEKNLNLQKFYGERIFLNLDNAKNFYIFKCFEAPPINHTSASYFILLEELMNSDQGLNKFKQKFKEILEASLSYEPKRRFGVIFFNLTLKNNLSKDSLIHIDEKLDSFVKDFLDSLKKEDFERLKEKILKQKVYDDLDPVYTVFYLANYLIYKDPLLKEKIIENIRETEYNDFIKFFKNFFNNSNSKTVIVSESKKVEKRVVFPESIHILFKKRIQAEEQSKNGISQVFFRALLNEKINKIIEKEGLKVKTFDNPYIPFDDYYHRWDFSYIRVVFASDSRDKIFDFIDKLLKPEFDTFILKNSKKEAILARTISEKDPFIRAWEEFEKNLFKDEGKSLYGDKNKIEKITLDDLYRYSQILKKENMIITYESENPDSLLKNKLKEISNYEPLEKLKINEELFIDSIKLNLKQSYILGGRIFDLENREEILNYISLSLILTQKMQEIIREKLGLSYRLSSGIRIYPQKILFYYEIGTDKENLRKVENVMEKIFEDIKRKIGEEEFEIAMNSFLGNYIRRLSNPETRSFYKGFYIYVGLGENFDNFIKENLKDVKLKNIRKLAKRVLNIGDFSKIYIF
ncbi:MAG: insulinase family protein [Candidatus Hydrothermales bacterium]